MQEYQERVKQESEELCDRTEKLLAFIESPKYASVPEAEQRRLRRQMFIMSLYVDVLDERIAAFPKE